MSKIMYLSVEKIHVDGLQTRASLNQDTVVEYAEATTAGGVALPPIVVFCDEAKELFCADGLHRLAAAKRTGQKKIAADVRDGTRVDALRFALGANGTHGLRRTNADKAYAVKMAYENRALLGLPDVPAAQLIADLVGVSATTAGSQIGTLFPAWAAATARTGADGKTYTLPPIPTRPPKVPAPPAGLPSVSVRPAPGSAAPAAAPQYPPPTVRRAPPAADVPPVPTKHPAKADAGPMDERGHHIPVDLLPTWNRRQEVQDLATAVSGVRVELRKAQEGQDPLYREVNFSSVLNNLGRAYTEITAAKPWCVCPMCQGIGCRACKDSGLMGEHRFKQVVPAEFKK